MAFYCQCMLQIATELALKTPVFERMVVKFAKHFAQIMLAMKSLGTEHDGMWDEEDGFFYDVLRRPDGSGTRSKGAISGRTFAALCRDSVSRRNKRAHAERSA